MSIIKLIQSFADHEDTPIQVAEILQYLRDNGVKDEIYFIEAPFSADILIGQIVHWERHDDAAGENRLLADIYTAQDLTRAERRLAECKELLHVLDPKHFRVNSYTETIALIDKIILHPSMVDFANEGVHANSDRAAIAHAMAALFPMAQRDAFMERYKDGTLGLHEIAETVDLPVEFVQVVMSDYWASVYDDMMNPKRRIVPDRVTALDQNDTALDITSVAIGDDPMVTAQALAKKDPGKISKFKIETESDTFEISKSDVLKPSATPKSLKK